MNVTPIAFTVNFATTTISYKVHKRLDNPLEKQLIIPNTHEAIIDEATFERVQELRQHRIRPTVTGRKSLFSGLVYCADCGTKLHFCASKSLKRNQEFFRCSNYKDGRGECSIHFIRDVVLERLGLEAVQGLATFIRCYEPAFLYLMEMQNIATQKTDRIKLQAAIDSGKRRIAEIDKLVPRIYEDNILGKLDDDRYMRMYAGYEQEQKELIQSMADNEKRLANMEQKSMDLHALLTALREMTDITELKQAMINKLIQRIEVHTNEKKHSHNGVKVDIYFTAVGMVSLADEKKSSVSWKPYKRSTKTPPRLSGSLPDKKGVAQPLSRLHHLLHKILPLDHAGKGGGLLRYRLSLKSVLSFASQLRL